ncbi:hypothetical protein [Limnoglobus roseus]|uniref:Uncharacterized protein n=1 Tax=Limnoglobus roseus TaxID=2598579 RepID=A0A5C1AKU1_9BACT|nr:hypothetical protein [Limnoglobus roseus]QEL19831.1 hypothetical protein PX52LOC_06912 [Limnoglobus roseus]
MPESPPTPVAKFDNAQRALYGEFESESYYSHDPGICWLPTGEPKPTDPEKLKTWRPMVPIQLYNPVRYRTVRSFGRKTGSPPLMPLPKTSGRFEFQGGQTTVSQPVQASDGVSAEWSVQTDFTYVENADPDYYNGGLVLGNAPYSTESNLAMDNFPAAYLADPTLRERSPGPRRGEAMSRKINHGLPNLGLPWTNGAYSENSYYPYTFTDGTMVSGGELPFPPPPPAVPTLPPSPGG